VLKPTNGKKRQKNGKKMEKIQFFGQKICQFQKWYYLCSRNSGH